LIHILIVFISFKFFLTQITANVNTLYIKKAIFFKGRENSHPKKKITRSAFFSLYYFRYLSNVIALFIKKPRPFLQGRGFSIGAEF